MRKVELLPTRDCEAGYAPEYNLCLDIWKDWNLETQGPCYQQKQWDNQQKTLNYAKTQCHSLTNPASVLY